jgi:hypothetical protein
MFSLCSLLSAKWPLFNVVCFKPYTSDFCNSPIHSDLCTSIHCLCIDHGIVAGRVREAYELCSPSSYHYLWLQFSWVLNVSDGHINGLNKIKVTEESINAISHRHQYSFPEKNISFSKLINAMWKRYKFLYLCTCTIFCIFVDKNRKYLVWCYKIWQRNIF